jgi:archaellum component FlaC
MEQLQNLIDQCFKLGELNSVSEALLGFEDKTPEIDHILELVEEEINKLELDIRKLMSNISNELGKTP